MRFLADAHVSLALVRAIRSLGHECTVAADIPSGMEDIDVMYRAASERMVIVTSDKDFGELVFRRGLSCPGVILDRTTFKSYEARAQRIATVLPEIVAQLPGVFVTVTDKAVRIRRIAL